MSAKDREGKSIERQDNTFWASFSSWHLQLEKCRITPALFSKQLSGLWQISEYRGWKGHADFVIKIQAKGGCVSQPRLEESLEWDSLSPRYNKVDLEMHTLKGVMKVCEAHPFQCAGCYIKIFYWHRQPGQVPINMESITNKRQVLSVLQQPTRQMNTLMIY